MAYAVRFGCLYWDTLLLVLMVPSASAVGILDPHSSCALTCRHTQVQWDV